MSSLGMTIGWGFGHGEVSRGWGAALAREGEIFGGMWRAWATRVTVEESKREEPKGEEIARDWKLVQEIREGNRGSYREIVERYQGVIGGRMWKFSRVASEHEELVQEVFVEGYLSLGNYRGEASLEHWLQKIATRVGYRFWTRRKRRREEGVQGGEVLKGLARAKEGMETAAVEAAETVYLLLARLPAEDRLVMTLLHLEEYSVVEIAEQTGWSESNVKVRAHRARKKLAEWLGEGNDG